MIGFNGTYLPAASLGNMRITAAALGGQWVIVGWLKSATKQAIIAAFGAEEGAQVILKTTDYLNAISLIDPQRAQQLAMFINEDPMLVCSLVETSKERWLTSGSTNAYIDTGFAPSNNTIFEISFARTTNGYAAAGSRVAYQNAGFTVQIGDDCQFNTGNTTILTGIKAPVDEFHVYKIDAISRKVYVDDRSWDTVLLAGNAYPIWLFALNNSGSPHNPNGSSVKYAMITDNGTIVSHFIPMQRTDGTCGMLDIISCTFYPNANTTGQFTISLTDK